MRPGLSRRDAGAPRDTGPEPSTAQGRSKKDPRSSDLSKPGRLADAGAAHMAQMLRSNSQLTSLDLSSNAIGARGGGEVLLALQEAKHGLVACHLRDNLLSDALLHKVRPLPLPPLHLSAPATHPPPHKHPTWWDSWY